MWHPKQLPATPSKWETWRFGVETNTLRHWKKVPAECVEYVTLYMAGIPNCISGGQSQYTGDSIMVVNEAIAYASSLKLSRDGKDAWVFDLDETLLSNLPLFAAHKYGGEVIDREEFEKWEDRAEDPPLPAKELYAILLELGFKIFIITGRCDYLRAATERNLTQAGYHSWEALLLRDPNDPRQTNVLSKSEKRLKIEEAGFRIRGNIGDQWSDLSGYSVGDRTFKLPNPMYYVP